MDISTLTLMGTIIIACTTATWVIRSQIGHLSETLGRHIESDLLKFKSIAKRLRKVERKQRRAERANRE